MLQFCNLHVSGISDPESKAYLGYGKAVWVGSRVVHVLTINEPLWSLFGSGPRPPPLKGLGAVYCVYICTNESHGNEPEFD